MKTKDKEQLEEIIREEVRKVMKVWSVKVEKPHDGIMFYGAYDLHELIKAILNYLQVRPHQEPSQLTLRKNE